MRAAILTAPGTDPELQTFDDPTTDDGQAVIEVAAAGVNPVDLAIASGAMGEPPTPSVVGQEGIGRLPDGRRVYFNPSVTPFGSWAERTLVDPGTTFDVPDGLADELAVTMGIAGLAAWLSLEHHARVQPGERVLVLGATGVVGKIAVQAAKVLQAGHVVAAGRNPDALEQARDLGADDLVQLGGDDDAKALREACDDGYDVVIDPVYGKAFAPALEASAQGARLVTLGQSAGPTAEVSFRALQSRTHIGHFNNATPLDVRRAAYAKLTHHAAAGDIRVDIERFGLDDATAAWKAQQEGPHHKLVVVP